MSRGRRRPVPEGTGPASYAAEDTAAAATRTCPECDSAPGNVECPHEVTCPDCAVTSVKRGLEHEKTCPAGLALDRTVEDDRRWFAAHPGEHRRVRPITPPEVVEAELFLNGWRPNGYVVVTQLQPGVRVRRMCSYELVILHV